MSDNLRRYRAIHQALNQWYPGEPSGRLAQHLTTLAAGLDHGVGHFRPLSITRQRHLLAYHGIAMSCEGLCQVF